MKNFTKSLLGVAFVFGFFAFGMQTASAVAPTVVSFSANPSTVTSGGSTTISWDSNNATSCVGGNGGSTGWAGGHGFSGTFTALNITSTTTFSIFCVNSTGQQSPVVSIQVSVNSSQSPVVLSFSANPSAINAGQNTVLTWNSSGATSCSASSSPFNSQWNGTKSANGNLTINNLTTTTTFSVQCFNANGQGSQVVPITVTVNQPQTCPSGMVGTPPNCSWPTPDAPTVNLTAVPTSIQSGQNSTLNWSVQDATSCFASGGWSGNKSVMGGTQNVSPVQTTTYTLTCTGPGGTASDSAVVTVTQIQNNPPSVTLTANPTSVSYNGSTVLTWTVSNATSCTANSNPVTSWTGSKSVNGGQATISNLTQSTFFNIFCTNNQGQSDSATVTVTVAAQPVNLPTVTITAQYTDVAYLGATDVIWHPSLNATSCVGTGGSPGWAGPKSNFSDSFYANGLTQTTTFTITCSNSAGTSAPASVTVHVASAPVKNPIVTTNAATGVNNFSATLNGLVNANGNSNVTAWFEWGTNQNLNNQTSENSYGSTSGTNFNYYLSGLQQNTTYYFRAVARGSNGQVVYGSILSFSTTNVCTNCNFNLPNATTYPASNLTENTAVLNGYVDGNGSSATRWFEWGTSYNNLFNQTGRVNIGSNGSNANEQIFNLQPNTTYYYRIVGQNQNGTSYGNVITFTTSNRVFVDPCFLGNCAPTVATTFASSVTTRSARLNGVAFVNGTAFTQGYFEWGTSTGLGLTTPTFNLGAGQSIPMFSTLSTLSPSTTYYYRAVATNQYGTARGSIVSFRTGTGVVIGVSTEANPSLSYRETTLVTNTNVAGTGVSKPSLVFLDTNCNGQVLRPGDLLQCTVHWKNVSNKNLSNVLLRTGFPEELEFKSATSGNYSPVDNSIVVEIGSLSPGQEGSMTFTTMVKTNAQLGKIIVVASNLVYSYVGDNGAFNQEEVFSYSDHMIEGKNGSIAGAAIFSGAFMPNSLTGWLVILLLILLVLLAAKAVYSNSRPTIVNMPPSNGGMH